MEFSTFLVFAAWTASMTDLTFGKERERAMLFPDYYFFAGRRLVNHAIEEKRVKNLDDCELLCYLSDSCVSLNFKKDPDNNQPAGHICELNNATHLKYDSDLTTDANFYYRGSKSACDKSSHCQNNATCQSGFTLKGYRCLCPPGFEGESCETDTDECEATLGKCHKEATCNNTNGSYVCTCKPGFIGVGRNCTDVDECKGNHSCHENANCRNTIGSHVCDCQPGYTGNGKNCTDIDECITYPGKCHVNATCNNTDGSHVCSCKPGYIGDGRSCTVDPCQLHTVLHDENRDIEHVEGYECDRQLNTGWYRFLNKPGIRMPTTCPPTDRRCGTTWPGWLEGVHPTVEDGIVARTVYFRQHEKCRKLPVHNIKVKNCSSFFVYLLRPTSKCTCRYCYSSK